MKVDQLPTSRRDLLIGGVAATGLSLVPGLAQAQNARRALRFPSAASHGLLATRR